VNQPPTPSVDLNALPSDPKERHEKLVDAFGQYIFWARDLILDDKRELVESSEGRAKLGAIFREPFDRMAELKPEQRDIAFEFAKECVDGFVRELMRLLAHAGFDLPMADQNVMRFRLVMEICSGETGELILEEVLNRGGRHFPDYWGRWLNNRSPRDK
jgi:hypothetical protein